jgi:hypothetical protein
VRAEEAGAAGDQDSVGHRVILMDFSPAGPENWQAGRDRFASPLHRQYEGPAAAETVR